LLLKQFTELRELQPQGRMRRMIRGECPECDEAVPLLARTCRHCGAPNPARRNVIAAAAGITVLAGASAGAVVIATRHPQPVPGQQQAQAGIEPQQPAAAKPSAAEQQPTGDAPQQQAQAGTVTSVMPPAATADVNFSWLSSAMTACDMRASDQPRKLHFLVIPLQANEKDIPDWRLLALGSIGTGITIRSDDALGGLRRGTLKIRAAEYMFSVQDIATRGVLRWASSMGANLFSSPDAQAIKTFRLMLQPSGTADQGNWSDVYSRQNASCHWIAAIMR
jgi:hypothetical protein